MPNCGILYIWWGGEEQKKFLDRSIESVRKFYPDIPIHIEKLSKYATLLDKSRMFDISPFDTTLYLDIDTVVLGNLDFLFQKAAQFGLTCTICESPWARRFPVFFDSDDVEYNAGVLCFDRTANKLFKVWQEYCLLKTSHCEFVLNGEKKVMMNNDQGPFAMAIRDTGALPFVVPLNWNFRPAWMKSWFGPIKIWHDYADVPEAIHNWNQIQRNEPGVVIQYCSFGPRKEAT